MIILTLKGGLGNQLFQYACGRAICLRTGNSMKLDASGYEKTRNSDTPREYVLSKFNIHNEQIASESEIQRSKYPHGIFSKLYRRIRTKIGLFNVGFVPRILYKKGDAYLDGYWQTEKYFLDQAPTIRKELTLKNPLGQSAQHFDDLIVTQKNRRGDVARDAWKNMYYGITTPEYYRRALIALTERIGASAGHTAVDDVNNKTILNLPEKQPLHIFVFSDDIEWVKQNIPIPFSTTYIQGAGIADYEELTLMSRCDHHIIANSSFSWWGAWLNPNPEKIVIAPKQWIRKRQWQHKDICPPEWVRV
jgi:Glycosyl transferase family 11